MKRIIRASGISDELIIRFVASYEASVNYDMSDHIRKIEKIREQIYDILREHFYLSNIKIK